MDERILNLLDRLRKMTIDPGEIHICPICGGKLHVKFGSYERRGKSLLGVQVSCETCDVEMAVDYVQSPPEWLKAANIKDEPS